MRRSTRERGAVLLVSLALFCVGAVMACCYLSAMKADYALDRQQLRTAQSLTLLQGQFERQLALYQHKNIYGEDAVRLAYDPYLKLPQEQPQPVVEADITGFNIKFKDASQKGVNQHKTEKSETFIIRGGATFRSDVPKKAGYNNVFIKIAN